MNEVLRKTCIVCGKEFETSLSRRKYCSDKCKEKKRYLKDKEKIRLRLKKYREKNKDKLSLYHKKYQETYRDKINQRKREYSKENQDRFLLTYKIGKCCSKCGYNEHPEILDFHHTGGIKKSFRISQFRRTSNSSLLKQEIEKCILLCPNCHRLLHINERKNKDG